MSVKPDVIVDFYTKTRNHRKTPRKSQKRITYWKTNEYTPKYKIRVGPSFRFSLQGEGGVRTPVFPPVTLLLSTFYQTTSYSLHQNPLAATSPLKAKFRFFVACCCWVHFEQGNKTKQLNTPVYLTQQILWWAFQLVGMLGSNLGFEIEQLLRE